MINNRFRHANRCWSSQSCNNIIASSSHISLLNRCWWSQNFNCLLSTKSRRDLTTIGSNGFGGPGLQLSGGPNFNSPRYTSTEKLMFGGGGGSARIPCSIRPSVRSASVSTIRFSSSYGLDDDENAAEKRRIKGIQMNPNGYSRLILPGDFVIKKKKSGEERKVFTDRGLGYFWMLKDLKDSDNKPILSNKVVIKEDDAMLFPTLTDLETLTGDMVDIPIFFVRNNRAKDATAQCTLVAISYKEFGFKLLPTWTIPFEEALCSSSSKSSDLENRFEVVRLSISEGRILKLLRGLLTRNMKRNTPTKYHNTTLVGFGNVDDFRDALRMHNTLTGYVYLLDGLGRVRWAGSGTGSKEEVQNLIRCARELTPELLPPSRSSGGKGGGGGSKKARVGHKVRRGGTDESQ